MIVISKNIDYEKKLNPIYIKAIEANQIYIHDCAVRAEKPVQYKMGNEWVNFEQIRTGEAVLKDSLFLRYMNGSIIRKNDECKDFIVLRFNYNAEYRVDGIEGKIDVHDLRRLYYQNGVTYTFEKKNKQGEVVGREDVHFKMLMRTGGKAKKGECVFIRENLHHKAINFLTMGLYDLMSEAAKNDPEQVFRLVELSAYQTLTTATAIGYISIPFENILVLKDREVYTDGMSAEVVSSEGSMENTKKKCTVERVTDARIKNVLWDGMGLVDESIFPKDMDGFIYCRSHFFKSCLFRGNLQEFFKDYCEDHNVDYNRYTLEKVDMFGRRLKLKDIKVVITDKSLKWLKFIEWMGGTGEKASKYYRRYMKMQGDYFSIVKTAHSSKWEDLQLMTYQMNNSLPTTDKDILKKIATCAVDYINALKCSDEEYLKYLDKKKNITNINELLIELVKWNSDFAKTELFRTKKSKDINKLKSCMQEGKMPQVGDNLTIMDNPVAMLISVFGVDIDVPEDEGCFEVVEDGVQCYAPRFKENDRLAAFRSPHNSPNNIVHLYNVYPDSLIKYFPNIGQNVVVFNAIKTDTQARLSGHDCDSDFVYVTNQKELAELARTAYIKYHTIINDIAELSSSNYHFSLEDYAKMDNQIADAQAAIGTSTDTAQLALSYYYDRGMRDRELEKCFIILSVIGQISIDLAKKSFDIDVMKEIDRIRRLPCMRGNVIPEFFAKTKKSRNNKEFDESKVIKALNCPMDILAGMIEADVIKYAPDRENYWSVFKLWNTAVIKKGSVTKYYKDKLHTEAEKYNTTVKYLKSQKGQMEDEVLFIIKDRAMTKFLNKVNKNLSQEAVMSLVIYAFQNDNSDVCTTILNFLYSKHKKEFLNCFIQKN